jgi:hypothetical protein
VIAGFKDYQIKYTILVLKPKQIKQQQMVIQKSDERFYTFIINPKINNIKIITGSPGEPNQTK